MIFRIIRYIKRKMTIKHGENYIDFLLKIKKSNITIRHDVDRDFQKIPDIIAMENVVGLKSTFHLRHVYDVSDIDFEGSNVALHAEFQNESEAIEHLEKVEAMTGRKIKYMSLHGGRTKTKLNDWEIELIMKKLGLKWTPSFISDISPDFGRIINKAIENKLPLEVNLHTEYF